MLRVGEGLRRSTREDSLSVFNSFEVYRWQVSFLYRSSARTILLLGCLVLLSFLVHLGVGSYRWYSPISVIHELLAGPHSNGDISPENTIVWSIRLPRAVLCLLVGALLGSVGSAFQAQLRNPLADPYIIGVSSGAAVGGVGAILLGWGGWFGGLALTGAGTVTGLASLALVYSLSRRRGNTSTPTLLLAGVVIGSLLSAILSLMLLAAGKDTSAVLSWLLGNTSAASWPKNGALLLGLVLGLPVLVLNSRRLNAFAMGHQTAQRLGVPVRQLNRDILVAGTLMTSAAVGAVGIVGFLGLVAPHIARRVVGVDWRSSLPASALIGSGLLLLADILAQRGLTLLTGTPGMELPVGAVTALLGAPSLLILLRRQG